MTAPPFPFTPVEFHEGWVKGKERIVSCVSFETDFVREPPTGLKYPGPANPAPPKVLFFDIHGRQFLAPQKVQVTLRNAKWHVKTMIDNWREFAIVEW